MKKEKYRKLGKTRGGDLWEVRERRGGEIAEMRRNKGKDKGNFREG